MPMGTRATVGLANTPQAPPMVMNSMMAKAITQSLAFLPPPAMPLKATSMAPVFCSRCTAAPMNMIMTISTAEFWKPWTVAFRTSQGFWGFCSTVW